MSLINHIYIPMRLWRGIYQTGSSIICNPPVLNTDIDYIICSSEGELLNLATYIVAEGFKESCKDRQEYELETEGFHCFRKDNINLIVTNDYSFYLNFVNATKLAKKLNLLKKEDRIILFQYILYGKI